MLKRELYRTVLLGSLLAFGACGDLEEPAAPAEEPDVLATARSQVAGGTASEFIIRGQRGRLPADLEAQVAARGGVLTATLPQIGYAFAAGGPDFAAAVGSIKGVAAAMPDAHMQWVPALEPTYEVVAETDDPPASGEDDAFYDLQWAAAAIDHPEALDAGHKGAGARVCVMDSGIRSTHADLAPNLNVALSTSFAADGDFDNPAGFHGTHVSGIVAAADNGIGTIGVAPEAELVMLKVLNASGSGSFSWLIQALVYAADIGCDVANMSLGSTVDKRGFLDTQGNWVPANAVAGLLNAVKAAAHYAHKGGVTLIAAAGNNAIDGNTDKSLAHLPSALPFILSISASGPMGWALDFDTDLDRLASYSNSGFSDVDLGAPGGDFALPGNDLCLVAGVVVPCWVFDMVMSTSNASDITYSWTAGTSMAAPHATGVAALIIGKNGGSMSPAAVAAALRASADAVGKPGKSSAFGHGRVNAGRAVGAVN